MGIIDRFFKQEKKDAQKDDQQLTSNDFLGDTILSFHQLINESIEWEELKNENFAMWLPCDQDKILSNSKIINKWTEIYSLTKNYWTYITADILKILGLVDSETFRITLPDDFRAFAFITPENEQIIFSICAEKGIRFHFSESTPFNYRLVFLDKFIQYCKAWSELIKRNNGETDNDIGFAEWWNLTVKASKEVETKGPVKVGQIVK